MDEACPNCPALAETRENVVHGYGDVGADFVFVGEMPDEEADETGIPFAGQEPLFDVLSELGLVNGETEEGPAVDNAYLTYLTRCRHPDRGPADEEIATCEPFLNADVRMINPEILVPIGARALKELAAEYTTRPADELDIVEDHASTIRGRGFELVPMIDPDEMSDEQAATFLDRFAALMDSDYRQTKGRRER